MLSACWLLPGWSVARSLLLSSSYRQLQSQSQSQLPTPNSQLPATPTKTLPLACHTGTLHVACNMQRATCNQQQLTASNMLYLHSGQITWHVTHIPGLVTNIRQLPPWSACHYTIRLATPTPHNTQHPSLRFWFCGNGNGSLVGVGNVARGPLYY